VPLRLVSVVGATVTIIDVFWLIDSEIGEVVVELVVVVVVVVVRKL
jgi:hypothetical protein